jgi:hypothetical protein
MIQNGKGAAGAKVVINLATGPEDAERVTVAFLSAARRRNGQTGAVRGVWGPGGTGQEVELRRDPLKGDG